MPFNNKYKKDATKGQCRLIRKHKMQSWLKVYIKYQVERRTWKDYDMKEQNDLEQQNWRLE